MRLNTIEPLSDRPEGGINGIGFIGQSHCRGDQLMELCDAFEDLAVTYPNLMDWRLSFAWGESTSAIVDVLSGALEEAQARSAQEMLILAETIRRDLTRLTTETTNAEIATLLDGMRFCLSTHAIVATLALGRHGDCYAWIHWSASRTYDLERRINRCEYRLPPFVGASASLNRKCLADLTQWIICAFLLARKFGGMDEWMTEILDDCVNHVVSVLQAGEIDLGVQAIVAIANWATNVGHPRARPLTEALVRQYYDPSLPARAKVNLGMLFATTAGQWSGQTPQAWAGEILRDFRGVLVEHETVQLLATSLHTRELWLAGRAELLLEIRRLANWYRSQDQVADATLGLEARVSILHPLIYNLVSFGSTADLMDVLWAWYGREGRERADANVLFVASAHGAGVTYVWPEGRWTVPSGNADTLDGLLVAVSEALNEYFRGPAGDRNALFDERLTGAPALEKAAVLQAQMREHYRLDLLPCFLPEGWRPRSVVVLPAHRDPLQALMSEALGWLSPSEASLVDTPEPGPVQKISIWPGLTQTTEAEVRCLQAVAAQAGWEIKVVEGHLDRAAFQRFYEDPGPDVLWVIGHGEQSPFRIEETGLVMADGGVLPYADVSAMTVPATRRRLVVLNICSAGATQNRGGLARIGLAHDVVGPHQLVIGHLWPIDYYAALAFGCALAINLRSRAPSEALAATEALMRDPPSLLAALNELSTELEACQRLNSNRATEQVSNLLSWGCPILLT